MPWPEEHKESTRERILDAAATMFRERGIEQTSLANIMQRAGLTHGGFYAHFDSKEGLVAEALVYASAQLSGIFATKPAADDERDPVLSAAEKYLSPVHLEHPERGCPVAALSSELIRSGQKVRKALAKEIRNRLESLCEGTSPQASSEIRRRRAAGALACMLGGLILARGLRESDGLELLRHCTGFLKEALERE